MARLKGYYGPADYEQKIIQAIWDGNSPGQYSIDDIMDDDDEGDSPNTGRKLKPRSTGSVGPQAMMPKYNMSYG